MAFYANNNKKKEKERMRDVRFIRYLSTIYTISNVVRHLLLGGAVKSTTNTKYTMQIVAQQQH
jgi:hypothetical protein